MIEKLHHSAYRSSDSEATRRFYEDFLGLPLVNALEISSTATGRATPVLHSFFAMDDGSCLAFFEAPDMPFQFKPQHDFDLHIALEVSREHLGAMLEKGRRAGLEVRGISDHGNIESIYFRDPDGYVVELAARRADRPRTITPAEARAKLDRWTQSRAEGHAAASSRWSEPPVGPQAPGSCD